MLALFIYIIFDILGLFFLEYSVQKKRKTVSIKPNHFYKYRFLLFISVIILSILIGLRDISVGTDTYGYVEAFYRIVDGTATKIDLNWLSSGYILLLKGIGFFFGKNYVIFNLVISFLSILFLLLAIDDSSDNPTFSLYIFISMTLYYQMMNQARQMLALCIVLYSFKFLKNRNLIKYTLFIIIAASIHESAIIMLPFYFMPNLKISKINILIYLIILFVSFYGFSYIENIILTTSYGKLYYGSSFYSFSITSVAVLIFRVLLLIMAIYLYKNSENNTTDTRLFNLVIICTILQVMTLKVHLIGRLTTYFYVFYIFLIPNLISKLRKDKQKKSMKMIFFVLFLIYHFGYYFLTAKGIGIDNYIFFLK